jgi:Uma2 family endonuclease
MITFISEDVVSQQQFEQWLRQRPWDDINRYELLEGRIVMNPPADWPEGEGELSIGAVLLFHVRPLGLGRVFGPSQRFELPTGDTVAPDASFISRERWAAGPRPERRGPLRIVPDLAVEVLSPNRPSRDLVQKRIIYARAGVREYWVIDLDRREVTLFRRIAEGLFDEGRILTENETLHSEVLPGFEVPVRDLLVED